MDYDKIPKMYLRSTGAFMVAVGAIVMFIVYESDSSNPPSSLIEWAGMIAMWGFGSFCIYNGLHRLDRSSR